MSDIIGEVSKIMNQTSIAMGFGRRKIWGIEFGGGIPEDEFRKFLEDPQRYIDRASGKTIATPNDKLRTVDAGQVIAVAKVLCIASKFYSTTICPLLGS